MDRDGDTYKIVRYYTRSGYRAVIKRGLTFDEAIEHVNDLNSKSDTCWGREEKRLKALKGRWYDEMIKE